MFDFNRRWVTVVYKMLFGYVSKLFNVKRQWGYSHFCCWDNVNSRLSFGRYYPIFVLLWVFLSLIWSILYYLYYYLYLYYLIWSNLFYLLRACYWNLSQRSSTCLLLFAFDIYKGHVCQTTFHRLPFDHTISPDAWFLQKHHLYKNIDML